VTAVVADPDYRRIAAFRRGVERLGLPYAVAIRAELVVWRAGARRAGAAGDVAKQVPEREWQRVCWGQGTKGPLAARFVALRARPARSRGDRWLLCERSLADDERKYDPLNLDATAAIGDLVRLARSRGPIEQQYRELKDELRFDYFEGRTLQGQTHHAVLSAMAFTFLQFERSRSSIDPRPTVPQMRSWLRDVVAILYVFGNRQLVNLMVSFLPNPAVRG
jgi:SRSO17 transposase